MTELREKCGCYRCQAEIAEREAEEQPTAGPAFFSIRMARMFLCPICGNKRCPHATDHRLACTGSNEPGQPGSNYGPPVDIPL